MTLDTISREEFDRRLEQSTEQMRQKRIALEARAAELERIEADAAQETDTFSERREDLRNILTELAERTSAVAASL